MHEVHVDPVEIHEKIKVEDGELARSTVHLTTPTDTVFNFMPLQIDIELGCDCLAISTKELRSRGALHEDG